MVPGKLGPERLTLKHNASGAVLKRDYLVPGSLPGTINRSWEKGDSGGEGEKDGATGSKWTRKDSGEREDIEKAWAREEGRDIGLGLMGMAYNLEEDVYATKHYKEPPLHLKDQHLPSYALNRCYSSSFQASSPHHPSIFPSPSPRLLPTHMSAFEYAIRPFLDNSPTHHGHNLVLPSPTSASFTSSEPSVPANPPSAAPSSWSHSTEQLYEATPLEQGLPEFLKGAKTLENRLRHLTLKTALLRCAILVRLIETSHDNDINPPNPLNSPGRLRIPSTSRSHSRGRSRLRAGVRTHSRLRSLNSYSDGSDPNSDDDTKTENYEAWSKVYTLAYRLAYPVAQRLGHQGLQARCLYWVGRAEWGLGNWENARKAFERVRLYGAADLRNDEKDWEFWFQKMRAKDVDDKGLGIDMDDKEDDDDEEQKQEDDQKKDFEAWEWEYITHGDLRKYKAAHRRKHRRISERVIPYVVSPTSHHLSPSSAWSLADRYQEHAFSPWNQILFGGCGGEISPPRENLGDILEREREGENMDVEDFVKKQ
jgi:hypothetical protein